MSSVPTMQLSQNLPVQLCCGAIENLYFPSADDAPEQSKHLQLLWLAFSILNQILSLFKTHPFCASLGSAVWWPEAEILICKKSIQHKHHMIINQWSLKQEIAMMSLMFIRAFPWHFNHSIAMAGFPFI